MSKLKWRDLSPERQDEIDEWLEDHHPWDYDAVYSLYHALSEKRDLGAYVCRGGKKGLKLSSTVGVGMENTSETAGEELWLTIEERPAILGYIELRYCEGMEIESFYLFHRASSLKKS
ncbi:hypothetical protein ACFL6E_05655 [Candidatus Neomarinimicrobiota bacterium]